MKFSIVTLVMLVAFSACESKTNSNEASDSTETVTQDSKPVVQNLSQANLTAKLSESNVILVDVRTPGEVSEGHIEGASVFIDFYSDDFQQKVKELDKSKTYVMYCRSGGRSGKAAKFMVDNGFSTVYNLEGGISSYTGVLAK